MNKAVFFDRDGILNRVIRRETGLSSPRSLQEFQIIEEIQVVVDWAKRHHYLVIVATNQPDVARGLLEEEVLHEMHALLQERFPIDGFEVCMSEDDSDPRRKPNPGMLLHARDVYQLNLQSCFFIGDSRKDVEAGKRAGVRTILFQTEYNRSIHGTGDFNCSSYEEILSIIKEDAYELRTQLS